MKLLALALAALLPCLAATPDAGKGKAFGNPAAPILIELFSDFQCPACKTLHEQTLPLLMRDFVVAGKVYLVHREFPLNGHAHSREAAEYATAAARLGKYEQVAGALFKNQLAWSADGKVWETVAGALAPADQKKLQALAKDPAVLAEVQHEVDLALATKINQTPTMIITHRLKRYPWSGYPNYDLFRRFLDDLLTK
jgi:protein-disulfide isomerase